MTNFLQTPRNSTLWRQYTDMVDIIRQLIKLTLKERSSVYDNRTHLYPESTALITEIEAAGVQLKPETYMEWSMALK